ncbi:DUF2065 domain-containing protein [Ottowia thiooxydans]|uniref:Uncharacterized protein YjeT (DUF2065 family) n=1 Tax=Ottowia thiooxydans TaxID=219182 RepID=A0ABV2QGR3_9BURK
MDADTLLMALGIALVLEGLMPFLAPKAWRGVFTQLLQMHDGQIRFFGLVSVLIGLALFWLV